MIVIFSFYCKLKVATCLQRGVYIVNTVGQAHLLYFTYLFCFINFAICIANINKHIKRVGWVTAAASANYCSPNNYGEW